MSAPLLWGPDGNTPVVMSKPDPVEQHDIDWQALLLFAFGALNGIEPGCRVPDDDRGHYMAQASVLILEALGRDRVEKHFQIELEVERRPAANQPES